MHSAGHRPARRMGRSSVSGPSPKIPGFLLLSARMRGSPREKALGRRELRARCRPTR
jgi:hypothetical protein